ncbi:MAG: hypothetical protein K2X08_06450 [Chlamydiales bacterium]|nr:hypothetical protein [Chlamydiales bacterium]
MNYISNFSHYISGLSVSYLFNNNDEDSGETGNAALITIAGVALVTIATMYFRNQLASSNEEITLEREIALLRESTARLEEETARVEERTARLEEETELIQQLGEHATAIGRGRQEREAHPFGRMRGNDCDFRLSRN